jgi:hypothetical protein
MNDLVSRQAILALPRNVTKTIGGKIVEETVDIEDIKNLPSAQPEIIKCKDCKNSEHWYRDRRRCFLWSEEGVSVFDDGFCNYAEMRMK